MSKTNVSAGPQTVIEIFRRLPPGRVVKIYQDVAAKDQIEIVVPHRVRRIDEVGVGEYDGAPQSFIDLMIAVAERA